MSLLSIFLMDEPIQIEPIRRLPHIRDLVTDVSWNYEINQHIRPLKPKPGRPMELTGCSRRTSNAFRNSTNVSNASSARMFVMSPETNRLRNLQDHVSSLVLLHWLCILWIPSIDWRNSKTSSALATATLPNAVLKSVRKISLVLITWSFHSKNESLEPFTIHWHGCGEAWLLYQNSHAEASTKFHEKVRME